MTEGDEVEKEGYIVEFYRVGDALKVTAIDPESLKEVSIVGAPKASQRELAQLAVRKLKYVLEKDKDT